MYKMSFPSVASKCRLVRTMPFKEAGQGLRYNLIDEFWQSGPLLEAVYHAQSRPVAIPICSRTKTGDAVQPSPADAPSR